MQSSPPFLVSNLQLCQPVSTEQSFGYRHLASRQEQILLYLLTFLMVEEVYRSEQPVSLSQNSFSDGGYQTEVLSGFRAGRVNSQVVQFSLQPAGHRRGEIEIGKIQMISLCTSSSSPKPQWFPFSLYPQYTVQ